MVGPIRTLWAAVALVAVTLLITTPSVPARATAADRLPAGTPSTYSVPEPFPPLPIVGLDGEVEIVGFTLKGNKAWERGTIPDLSIKRLKDGRRFLPLFRIVQFLALEKTDNQGIISFTPDGSPPVAIDPDHRTLTTAGKESPIEIVTDSSGSSDGMELYLSADTIAELFGFDLQWHEQGYEFVARTNRRLGIWKVSGGSLFGILARDLPANLPEAHPPATPHPLGLDFLELQLNARAVTEKNFSSSNWGAETLRQTFWGRVFNGSYRLQFSEPRFMKESGVATSRKNAPIMLDRGEWIYRFPSAEVAIGDAAFGLNDLTLPFVRISGVRFNGVTGFGESDGKGDRSGLGMRPYFLHPQLFTGNVPKGSRVDLMMNGRIIDSQEAIADRLSPPGMGSYRFEDVILSPGSLNEIVIVITDPNGVITRRQEFIQGTSELLSAGELAYLGGIGVGREVQTWATRGLFGGIRGLYGITDRLTMGGSIGYEKSLYRPLTLDSLDPDQRQYPDSSLHAGSQFAWQPSPYGLLGGDISFSRTLGEAKGAGATDAAYKTYVNLFPRRGLTISSQFFNYGPDFYDGQNSKLHDRRGYSVNGLWSLYRSVDLSAAFGSVWDNLDGTRGQTLTVGFQKLEITTRPFPTTVVTGGMTRLAASSEEPRVLYAIKLRTTPLPDLSFDGSVITGNSLVLSERPEFFSGLKIPGLATFAEPSTTAILRNALDRNNELAATYWKSGYRERSSLLHSFRGLHQDSLSIRTELGYDMDSRGPFLENRSGYLFSGVSRRSVELLTRYERKEWVVGLFLNLAELVSFERGTPLTLTSRNIHPDSGGIKGKVFLDYNGNASPDPDEPGLESIKVKLGSFSCETDRNGVFVLPGPGYPGKVRISLDLKTVPANYTPTHGTQIAHISPGSLTEVNLGVIPVISISGLLLADLEGEKKRALSGVRVYLVDPETGKTQGDSVTASDGSYYLGEVRPGKYLVRIDTDTLPKQCSLVETERLVEVQPEREPQDLRLAPFNALLTPVRQGKTL